MGRRSLQPLRSEQERTSLPRRRCRARRRRPKPKCAHVWILVRTWRVGDVLAGCSQALAHLFELLLEFETPQACLGHPDSVERVFASIGALAGGCAAARRGSAGPTTPAKADGQWSVVSAWRTLSALRIACCGHSVICNAAEVVVDRGAASLRARCRHGVGDGQGTARVLSWARETPAGTLLACLRHALSGNWLA